MALYFQKIVDAVLDGRDQPDHRGDLRRGELHQNIGFDIGDARISIGLVIDAVISFVVVAFFLFLVVKAYNNFDGQGSRAPRAAAPERRAADRDPRRAARAARAERAGRSGRDVRGREPAGSMS